MITYGDTFIELELGGVGCCGGRKTGEPREPSEWCETQATYDMGPNRTRATLVEDESTRDCAIPAPKVI